MNASPIVLLIPLAVIAAVTVMFVPDEAAPMAPAGTPVAVADPVDTTGAAHELRLAARGWGDASSPYWNYAAVSRDTARDEYGMVEPIPVTPKRAGKSHGHNAAIRRSAAMGGKPGTIVQ